MRSPTFASLAAGLTLLGASGALARQQDQQPVTDRNPDAERVAETPLRDFNVKKDGIPSVLEAAARDPYAVAGLSTCSAVAAAIRDLDTVLGPDFDTGETKRRGVTAGKVAESAVGSLIPFRGLIREVSGAASAERQLQVAIFAGATRRGFLKALGLQRGCALPARPATVSTAVSLRN